MNVRAHPLVVRRAVRSLLFLCALLPFATPTLPAQETSAEVLLEKARYEADIRGDLEAAILIYRRIVEEQADHRSVAARALLELAGAYEALGREGARDVYGRIVREYADQVEAVEVARGRLAALTPAEPTARSAAEGLRMRRLWAADVGLHPGDLSPDGERVAFVNWGLIEHPALPGHADVAIHDIAAGDFRRVTNRPPLNELDVYPDAPVWSRDGRWLAYGNWAPGWTHQELRVVRPDGTSDRVVLDVRQMALVRPMAFSSGGDFVVALLRGWDDAWRIGVVPTDGRPFSVLKTLGPHRPRALSLSPDDRFVAYDGPGDDESGNRDVFAVAVDGSLEVPVSTHPADDARAFWTPAGDRIVFESDRSGQRGLWAADWDGGRVTGEPELVYGPLPGMDLLGLTASGSPYFRAARTRSEVYVADIDLRGDGAVGEPETLPESGVLTNLRPAWSPDGSRVAWLSMRGGGGESPHLVVKTLATDQEVTHPLPFPLGDFRASRPDWSTDGRHVWVEGRDTDPAGRGRVSWRIDVATGEVAREPYHRDFAGVSRAEGITEFHFVDGRQWEGLRAMGVRLAGQTDFPLFEEGDARLRPGERLIWVRNGVQELVDEGPTAADSERRVALEGDHLRPVIPESPPVEWSLAPDGTALAVAAQEPGSGIPNVLWVVPLDGGEPRVLARKAPAAADEEGQPHFTAVRWSPNGEEVIYGVHQTGEGDDAEAEIWMVPAEGGVPRRLELSLSAYVLGNLRFHPDGDRIAYTVMDRGYELWLAEGLPWQTIGRR